MKNNLPKVKFIFDTKKELEYIDLFVNKFGEDSFLPTKIKILFDDNQKGLIKILKESYNTKLKKEIEKDWKTIEKDYFRMVEEITGYKWIHKEYEVVLTRYILGVCNPFKPKTNEVAVNMNTRKDIRNYIIAHEIFHSHYFNLILKKDKKLSYTEYNENADVLALLFTKMRKLFPKMTDEIVESCISSHPNAERYFKKLLKAWNKRKNFDDYLYQSLKLVKINYD